MIAIATIGIWAISFWNCSNVEIGQINPILLICLITWQMWTCTGLFITAHDAIHGTVHPSPQINYTIGQLCMWLYAGFDYPQLQSEHHQHHRHPATDRDPDFHNGHNSNFWPWYWHFICGHISWPQMLNLAIITSIYTIGGHLLIAQLAIFWILPSLLSSLQLFYFGTFLPHREPLDGYVQPHCATTIPRSRLWSFISCYHFGYHYEHHESPGIPWWKLGE